MSERALESIQKVFTVLMEMPEVQKGLDFILEDHQQTIKDQLELVVIKSPSTLEHQRAARFAEMLREVGLENVYIDERVNVIALKKGAGTGPTLMVEAHIDTVFPMETEIIPRIDPDGTIHAPGIADDTRGMVSLLSIARAFYASAIPHAGDIYFVGTACEEGIGDFLGMKDFLRDHAGMIDASVSIDGGGSDRISHSATGIKTMEFRFFGIGGHSFGAFGTMANPLHAAARAIAKIADFKVPEDPKTTFSASIFTAGNETGICSIVEQASFSINFRSYSPEELAKLEQAIFKAVQDACDEETERWGKDTITWEYKYWEDNLAGKQDVSVPIVQTALAAMRRLDIEPDIREYGSTNASIAIVKGIPAICLGSGGTSGNAHSTLEWHHPDGAYQSPQLVFLTLLALSGIQGHTESTL
jgi:acetylornithine deacetylase/succinyl-diaminopimelate desuccinylase-like protein